MNLADQLQRQDPGAFHRQLMRIKLRLHEGPRRVDDHPLFFGQSEIHHALARPRVEAGPHLVLEGCGALVPPAAKFAAVRVWVVTWCQTQ